MKTISIIIGKIIIFFGKILHRGSVLPGYFALKIDKNLLKKLKLPKIIIAVTGSSGKGSTTKLLVKIFKDQNFKVTYNKESNLTEGITTALINDLTLTGKLKTDVLVMEVDERYTKYIFKDINPNILVVTNICRDQPPRQGHFDLVFEEIKKSINKDTLLVLNGDDPYLRKFNKDAIYYGIEKNKYSYKENIFMNLNINYCPICNNKLKYNYYNFENNGDYFCSKCDFKRPDINYKVTNIDYENNSIEINNKNKIDMGYNILFSIYNTLAAYTVADIYKLNENKIIYSINEMKKDKKIYNTYDYKDRKITVLNNKNENNSTFNQSLLYINRFKDEKTIIIGWKEISRRYNFNDISWLYDIDFEILNKHNINKIICVGINRYDIATRLKLADITSDKIITFETLNETITYIDKNTKGNIYAILNFDYIKPFNKLIGSVIDDN